MSPPSTWELMFIDQNLERTIKSLQEALERADAATRMDSPVDVDGMPFVDPIDDSPAPSYSYAMGLLAAQIDIALYDLKSIRTQLKNA